MNVIKSYLLNSSFHGIPFVADSRFHWTERLYWVICVILSWWTSVYVMTSYYSQFLNGAISFTVDTSYLKWKSNFPAVVFCEKGNYKYHRYLNEYKVDKFITRVMQIIYRWFGSDRDYNTDDIMKDIVFFRGILEGVSYQCKSEDNSKKCPQGNYSMYANLARSKCEEIFQFCQWNNEIFPCCTQILPIETVYGVCYGLNLLENNNPSRLSMTVQHKLNSSIGQFGVELLHPDLKIFVLSREEVPSYSEGTTLVFDGISTSSHYKEENNIYIAVEEMVNEKEVKTTSIKRRGCIFPDENFLKTANVYSYSACLVECLTHIQLEICKCYHHLMPKAREENMCDMDGLICLSLNFEEIIQKTENCECESSCTEMNIKVLGSTTNQNFTGFEYEQSVTKLNFVLRAPTVRYIRRVVNGYLDLIVSFGGTAGLCVGASVLTGVEILYYFLIRPLTDEKRKIQNEKKVLLESKPIMFKKKSNFPPFPFVN